jgi:hypothetical protein
VSMELPFFIPISAFPVSLLDMGFLRIAGFATLVLDKEPLTISLLMKYGAPLLVSVVFLPDLLWIRGFSALAWVLIGWLGNGNPEEGTL